MRRPEREAEGLEVVGMGTELGHILVDFTSGTNGSNPYPSPSPILPTLSLFPIPPPPLPSSQPPPLPSSQPLPSPPPNPPLLLEVGLLNPARGLWERWMLFGGVWGGAPAAIEFGAF